MYIYIYIHQALTLYEILYIDCIVNKIGSVSILFDVTHYDAMVQI